MNQFSNIVPCRADLVTYQDALIFFELELTEVIDEETGEEVDLTGCSMAMYLKRGDGTAITMAPNVDMTNKKVSFSRTVEESGEMALGKYEYTIWFIDPDGNEYPFFMGTLLHKKTTKAVS